ncbi:uncharacterized protein LOC127802414 [Diospyros lotus]|uniref:uncharacterized protein LOC127802414 n=1 Tax=Diospyros lotus TaxID=55363 RepID=UPI00225701FD|nr:uncharacterized protein LOC127802414 [Diospyros lotus]
MSLENDIQSSVEKSDESVCEPKTRPQLSYTRDFLLSLSNLDVCKQLPSGFDPTILSELEDASHDIQERQRVPGNMPLQGYRRNEYGSSPPTRGDSGNYSRGLYGRWDNRSSGRNERDSDSQSDRDSDSGRRHGNQSRRSWQGPEHDGLLGSGSFPRPSGFAAGLSAPKVRSNDNYQLNRSTEPYHPPRPYKAVPNSRRDTHDSFNDETFGSSECASQDRAEAERRRRESFEVMRKEQQKALQEKQKLKLGKHKDDHVSDFTELLEDGKDVKRVTNRSNELDESVTQPVPNNDSGKSSCRPLVPPGFKSTILERNSSTKPLTHSHSEEVGRPEIEESFSHAKANVQNGTLDNQEERQLVSKVGFGEKQHENSKINTQINTPSFSKGEQILDALVGLEVLDKKLNVDDQLYRTSSLSEASETHDNSEIIEISTKKVSGHKIIGNPQEHAVSILDKLFGSALTVNPNGASGLIEPLDTEQVDKLIPNAVQSSKFAHWFLEDENKAAENSSYGRPNDLLSLIVGGEKVESPVPDVKANLNVTPDLPFQNSELTNRYLTSNMPSSTMEMSEQFYNGSKQEPVVPILTCEDLEQTILSEYSSRNSTLQTTGQGWSGYGGQESKADIDNRASQHLLSLLQKGTGLKDIAEPLNLDSGSLDKLHVIEGAIVGSANDNTIEEKPEKIHQSGKTLTLETLFGSAFMKELQSAEAPVSAQRGVFGSVRTDTSEPHGSSFAVMDGSMFPNSAVGTESNSRSSHESNILLSNQEQQIRSEKVENWLGINGTQIEADPSKHQNDIMAKLGGFDASVDIQLPEEESLITVGDPVNTPNSSFMPAGNSNKGELLPSNRTVDIAEKLAALSTAFKDERPMIGQEGPPFGLSPQLHPPSMHQGRPFFHQLDQHPSHVNSQVGLMTPEGIIHHDIPGSHQFPGNMFRPPFHHPKTGPAGFDLPPHPILQQIQMRGTFPPPHLLREIPRGGGSVPSHLNNHATGFMQESNPMQGFPFSQQQPNFGGPGLPLQGPDLGHPEAFQRLIEMERGAKSKQIHPLAAAAGQTHGHGMYGHELDMGFRYR